MRHISMLGRRGLRSGDIWRQNPLEILLISVVLQWMNDTSGILGWLYHIPKMGEKTPDETRS